VEIIIADNQSLTAAGIQFILSQDKSVKIAAILAPEDSLQSVVARHRPALLIADYNLDGYINKEQIAEVQRQSPATNVLILSADDDRSEILEVLRLGVKGYITKDCGVQEIINAVKTVGGGGKYFSQKILNILLESSITPEPEVKKGKTTLSERELELLRLLAKGYSTHRAAETLNLSPHTIHSHRKNIIKKLNIKSPTQYVLHAIDLGLITAY
jgi:DNA-binding NarL/FixJ family response regulator